MSKTDRPASAESKPSETGYAKPPVEHRFKKGTSGNPSGRRKAPKPIPTPADRLSISELTLEEAYRPIQIRENGKVEEVPLIQAVIRSLGVSAAKGNLRAQLSFEALFRTAQDRASDDVRAVFRGAMEYKTVWRETFEACDRAGEPRPDPVPHPDDIAVDARTLGIRFNGPVDEGEKAIWDLWKARKSEAEAEILALQALAITSPEFAEEIPNQQFTVDFVARTFPDEETRRNAEFNLDAWRDRQTKRQEAGARVRPPKKT